MIIGQRQSAGRGLKEERARVLDRGVNPLIVDQLDPVEIDAGGCQRSPQPGFRLRPAEQRRLPAPGRTRQLPRMEQPHAHVRRDRLDDFERDRAERRRAEEAALDPCQPDIILRLELARRAHRRWDLGGSPEHRRRRARRRGSEPAQQLSSTCAHRLPPNANLGENLAVAGEDQKRAARIRRLAPQADCRLTALERPRWSCSIS